MKKILVLVNPISGSGKGAQMARPLEAALRGRGLEPKVVMTPGPGTAAGIIQELGRGFDAVVAVGGDGTISETAGGMHTAQFNGPLGLAPLGLSNCLARHFKIPQDPDQVAAIIAGGVAVEMGLVLVGDRVSLSFVGAGLDAEIADRVARGRTGPVKDWTYVKAGLAYYRTKSWPKLQVRVDGRPVDGVFYEAILSAIDNYAHYFMLDESGEFKLYLFQGQGPRALLKTALKMGWRRKLEKAGLVFPVRERVEIASLHGPGCWQIDGEAGGVLPLECRILPKAIRILAPSRG